LTDDRLTAVLNLIDDVNRQDPERITIDEACLPAALVYGHRMSATLMRLAPEACEHLQIAARGQHIERWTQPRSGYPEGRIGYLKWRKALQSFHADRLAAIMTGAGYGEADAERVGSLVRKERIKQDPEAQTLEDVACLVFLEHYADDLFSRYRDDKVVDILQKTARKMSPRGLRAAGDLAVGERLGALLARALAC
jgi:hypothetical protein